MVCSARRTDWARQQSNSQRRLDPHRGRFDLGSDENHVRHPPYDSNSRSMCCRPLGARHQTEEMGR
eukprot:7164612-Pyramimonas_sp.AAC.1